MVWSWFGVALRFWVSALTLIVLVACGSDRADINAPLPRMGKRVAYKSARQLVSTMAAAGRVEISNRYTQPAFTNCVGRNYETAHDGRFNLDYYARADLAVEKHVRAIDRIRIVLEKHGVDIEGHQRMQGERQSVILRGRKSQTLSFSVEGSYRQDQLRFAVHTPCLLPPGRPQQQY